MRTSTLFAALALLAVLAAPAAAQTLLGSEPGTSSVRTRAELERLLDYYDEVVASPAYSSRVKAEARASAEQVRLRLRDGDFKVGDRIVLSVQGEPDLPDTAVVEAGPRIVLPLFGEIPLHGVLRSEIEAHLTEQLGRAIRNPVVRAQGLMRLSVQGTVGAPGFYVAPAETLVSEALMMAGGPSAVSDLQQIRIERGPQVLLAGEQLQEAMRAGWTLDQLNLQAGDQIFVPAIETGGGIWGTVGRVALGVIPGLLLALLVGR